MRIAHIADVHLDRPFAGMRDGAADQARARLRRTFTRCLGIARDADADLITIGGDLWEEENVRIDTRRFVAGELARCGLPVVMICGNHDPYLAGGSYMRTDWPENVTLIRSSDPEAITVAGVSVWGLSWTGGQPLTADFLARFRAPEEGRHVLLLHGTSTEVDLFAGGAHCPFRPSDVESTGFDLCLAGHVHRASHRDGVVYPGSPEPLGWAETGQYSVAIVDVGDTEIGVELVSAAEHRYLNVQADCTGCESSLDVSERAAQAIPPASPDLHVRVTLSGQIDRDCEVNVASLEADLGNSFAELRVADSTQPAYDLEHLAEQGTVRGLFVRDLQEQIALAATDEDRAEIEMALLAGLRALDGRGEVVDVH